MYLGICLMDIRDNLVIVFSASHNALWVKFLTKLDILQSYAQRYWQECIFHQNIILMKPYTNPNQAHWEYSLHAIPVITSRANLSHSKLTNKLMPIISQGKEPPLFIAHTLDLTSEYASNYPLVRGLETQL